MQLALQTSTDERWIEWSQYALLRDNVQHYVECGHPRPEFGTLHSLERAVEQGSVTVTARTLRQELQTAWGALGGLRLYQSAISLRTRAILTGCRQEPLVRGTALAGLMGWSVPVQGTDEQLLQDALRPLFDAVMQITASADDVDTVTVVCPRAIDAASA